MSVLTKEYLLWLFEYDRDRGVLIWKNHWAQNANMFIGKKQSLGCFETELEAHNRYKQALKELYHV